MPRSQDAQQHRGQRRVRRFQLWESCLGDDRRCSRTKSLDLARVRFIDSFSALLSVYRSLDLAPFIRVNKTERDSAIIAQILNF